MATSAGRSIEKGYTPVTTVQASLIDELEAAMKSGSAENRVNTLRRITDLFLHDADRLNDEQIGVFDDVLCLLTAKIEKTARLELAKRLAPVDTAPVEMVRRLARDDEIDVAWPVLTESKRLTDYDLVEIAQTKSQAHLLAISGRTQLQPPVTDALLDRGNREVVSTLAKNAGAHFSEPGFTNLVRKSEGDDDLALAVGLRNDIPLGYLRDLLRRATEAVRQRLLTLVPPQRRQELKELIAKVADAIGGTAEPDFAAAEAYVRSLEASGKLNEIVVLNSVIKGRREEMIVALARLCSTPVRTMSDLLSGHRSDMVLIPCKAADLSWPTVDAVLRYRLAGQTVSEAIVERARADYAKLTRATAQRTLRFMQVREAVA
jgi:uncharacterized protein (DUF2336 family)